VLTGSHLRQYRKLLGLNQTEFARRLGFSQTTISQIEAGRISLSNEHVQKLADKFSSARLSRPFPDFKRDVEKGAVDCQAALSDPQGRFVTLMVWRWDAAFDLARVPSPEDAVDVVTVRAGDQPAIAIRVGRRTKHWEAGETFVFERCNRPDVDDGEICLVQSRTPRSRGTRTMIAVARAFPAKRGRNLHFAPVSPVGSSFAADDNLVTLLRAIYRGRYLR
jgi:transcriptional regulator with XRE-family HTH domain